MAARYSKHESPLREGGDPLWHQGCGKYGTSGTAFPDKSLFMGQSVRKFSYYLSNDYEILDKLSNNYDSMDKLSNAYNLLDRLSKEYDIAIGQNVKRNIEHRT